MGSALEYEIRSSLTASHRDELLRLYANEWWTSSRTRADVDRMLAATDLIFAMCDVSSGSLLGFARVLTDTVFIALILDVIIAPDHRGRGLGRALVERVLADPALRAVASIELVCQPELAPFYEQWGFSARVGRSGLMRRTADPALRDAAAR